MARNDIREINKALDGTVRVNFLAIIHILVYQVNVHVVVELMFVYGATMSKETYVGLLSCTCIEGE